MPPETALLVAALKLAAHVGSWVQAWQLGGAIGSALFLVAPADAPIRRGKPEVDEAERVMWAQEEVKERAKKFLYAWVVSLACAVTVLKMTGGLNGETEITQLWG